MPDHSQNHAFDRLADRIVQRYLDFHPVDATWLGLHDGRDCVLPDRSAGSPEREIEAIQEMLREISEFKEKDLALDQIVDAKLARSELTSRLLLLQRRPESRESPVCYLEDVMLGAYSLMIRETLPLSKRVRALTARLELVPEHLEVARRNLINPPAVFTETAALSARGGIELFGAGMREFGAQVEDPRARAALLAASDSAREALDAYREWLEGSLMPLSAGDFSIGRHLYERLLVEKHHLPWDADQLIGIGQKLYQETMREMKRVSARIDSTRPWSKVVEHLKGSHPSEEEILSTYTSEMRRAQIFARNTDLVTFPETAPIDVLPTPGFARPMIPYAYYLPPAPFAEDQTGIFWVTTVDPDLPEARRETLLKGHAQYGIVVTALHEVCPGHHLQQVKANQFPEHPIRRVFRSSVLTEGWAFYCEEMMHSLGFYADDRIRLLQLKDTLWRACRVIIDVELQTGRMGFNDAATFLVRKARLERPNAVAEVRRYCGQPTQPMSYVAGMVLIQELLADYRAVRGDRFSLKEFHDDLLGHGALPIELIRLEMGIPRTAPRGGSRRGGGSSRGRRPADAVEAGSQ